MKQSLTIRIPDDLREELQEISKVEAKPVSDLVRESIQKYISIYRFHQLRDKVLPFAEAQGILTDEDVSNLLSLKMSSEAYLDWVSPENDIYDEMFKDTIELDKEKL
jgi:predicted transcriptional regulator